MPCGSSKEMGSASDPIFPFTLLPYLLLVIVISHLITMHAVKLMRNASAVAPSLLRGWRTLCHLLGPLCTQVARTGGAGGRKSVH